MSGNRAERGKRFADAMFSGVAAGLCLAVLAGVVFALAVTGGCLAVAMRPNARDFQPPREETLLATGYCNCQKCCGWKYTWYGRSVVAAGKNAGRPKKVGITASGRIAARGTIAADPSVFPFGTRMVVPGYGLGTVQDVGKSVKGAHIDVWFSSHKEAVAWGTRKIKVKVARTSAAQTNSSCAPARE